MDEILEHLNQTRRKHMKTFVYLILPLILTNCGSNPKPDNNLVSNESVSSKSDNYKDFTLEESQVIHRGFVEEKWGNFRDWALQGNATRYIYLHFSEFWPHTSIKIGNTTKDLPINYREEVANFNIGWGNESYSLKDYVKSAPVNGALVVHQGKIVFEYYPRMLPDDKHVYMSISKIFVSLSVAILEDRGLIDVSKPIADYLPKLKGSNIGSISIIEHQDIRDAVAGESGFTLRSILKGFQ